MSRGGASAAQFPVYGAQVMYRSRRESTSGSCAAAVIVKLSEDLVKYMYNVYINNDFNPRDE